MFFCVGLMLERRGKMEKEIVVLDEGIDVNAASDSVRGWGICCWANFMPFR